MTKSALHLGPSQTLAVSIEQKHIESANIQADIDAWLAKSPKNKIEMVTRGVSGIDENNTSNKRATMTVGQRARESRKRQKETERLALMTTIEG